MNLSRANFRQTRNYLLGHVSEVMAPFLRSGANLLAPGHKKAPAAWRRGLIIGQARIGDVLFRTCSLEQLKRGLPDCDWYYLTAADSAEVLRGNPFLKSVLTFCDPSGAVRLLPGAAAKLRGMRFDVALCTDFESYWLDHKIALEAGIANRVGFTYRGLSGLVTEAVPCPYPSPWAAYFRQIVSHVTGLPPEWCLIPKIYPSEEDERLVSDQWQKMTLPTDKPVVACFMTTRGNSRVWPRDQYAEALQLIHQNSGACIVVAGSKSDAAVLQEFISKCEVPCQLMAGELGLRALYCFLKKCSVIIAPDSAPRHIGNAAGTPVVFIRNLYCFTAEAGKYCENETDVSPVAELIPFQQQDGVLRRVSPALVAQTVLALLRRN